MFTLMQAFNSNRINPLHIQGILVMIFLFTDIVIYKICSVCLTILQIHINVSVLNTTTFITGSSQMYNRLFETNKTSVINQPAILTNDLPAEYRCLVVHTLKSQADPNNPKHRYLFFFNLLENPISFHKMTSGHHTNYYTKQTKLQSQAIKIIFFKDYSSS